MGAFFATISGKTLWAVTVVSQEMVYVMLGVTTLYLSRDCTVDLGIIFSSCPHLGDMDLEEDMAKTMEATREQRDTKEQGEPIPCSKMGYVEQNY